MTTRTTAAPHAPAKLIASAHRAIEMRGAHTAKIRIADQDIRLVGAGPDLVASILPALAHLRRPDDATPADLTVLVWDSASTGVPLPHLGAAAPAPGSAVTPIIADHSFVFHAFEQAVSYLDRPEATAVWAVADASAVPPWERACPLRAILTWWFAPRGQLLVHAAAVSRPTRAGPAVLLAGPGGSGKSTTALACVASGWGYLGDDYVLVGPGRAPGGAVDEEAAPHVWSVYGSAKLAPDHLARFPDLLAADPPRPHDPPDAKRLGWPARARPEVLVPSAPLASILLPRVTDQARSTCARVPASRALLALGPPTMFQTENDRPTTFRLAASLAGSVPAHQLDLGADLDAVPALIAGLDTRLDAESEPGSEADPRGTR